MILHEHRVNYKYGDEFTLKPLFDVHLGNTYCDEKAVKAYLSDTDEKTIIIGGGDLLDSVITKDLKRYMKHTDDTTSDAVVDEQVDRMYEILLPYKDNIVGLGVGNHEYAINKYCGTHPMRRLCEKLDVPSLGYSWLVRLIFREKEGRGRTLMIRGHHGWGGGSRTQGADLTKYSKDVAFWEADLFLYGHTHRRVSDVIERMSWVGKKLVAKPKHIFICGTFLKTYSLTDEATYSEIAGYPPTSIGGVNIKIKPTATWMQIEGDI